jgi:ABC-type multidrug transport system fused ATPase/permease subunit
MRQSRRVRRIPGQDCPYCALESLAACPASRDAPILILDEATSPLDAHSEALITASIDELRRDRTTFVVAHRIATVENADLIVVLRNGRVVETGTHAELIGQGGEYAGQHRAQFDA